MLSILAWPCWPLISWARCRLPSSSAGLWVWLTPAATAAKTPGPPTCRSGNGGHCHAGARCCEGLAALCGGVGPGLGLKPPWRWWGWRRLWATCTQCSSISRAERCGNGRSAVWGGLVACAGVPCVVCHVVFFTRFVSLASMAAVFAPVISCLAEMWRGKRAADGALVVMGFC